VRVRAGACAFFLSFLNPRGGGGDDDNEAIEHL